MKTKLIVLFAVLSVSFSGLLAQNRRPMNPEEMAKRQSETLTDRLKLNDEQKSKVYDVSLKYSKERTEQMSSNNGDRDQRRQKMQESQKKQDEEIKAILTEEQKKEYDKYTKERQSPRGSRRR